MSATILLDPRTVGITYRLDAMNKRHAYVTVFDCGAKAGELTLDRDTWDSLAAALKVTENMVERLHNYLVASGWNDLHDYANSGADTRTAAREALKAALLQGEEER